MKKFLIGIATLVAAVMLSSPAFGAIVYPSPDGGDGYFTFGLTGDDTELVSAHKLTEVSQGSKTVIQQMEDEWEAPIELFKEYEDTNGWFDNPNEDYTSGNLDFKLPVEFIVAKWDGYSYAFKVEGPTQYFEWFDLEHDMSHVRAYNAVPVPAAVWLLGSGVLGLVAIRRRRS